MAEQMKIPCTRCSDRKISAADRCLTDSTDRHSVSVGRVECSLATQVSDNCAPVDNVRVLVIDWYTEIIRICPCYHCRMINILHCYRYRFELFMCCVLALTIASLFLCS